LVLKFLERSCPFATSIPVRRKKVSPALYDQILFNFPFYQSPFTHHSLTSPSTDYLHLTKRFGIVAASQLPLHYLLSAKLPYNPIQHLSHLSHEELNPYHRLSGRILITFFALHATLYLNFYLQMGFLAKRIKDPDVQLGLLALTSFLIIGTSALSSIRTYSYRLFYTLHILLSFTVLPTLYFHVPYLRTYILETALIYIFLVLQRSITSQSPTTATLTPLPSTNLIHLSLTVPRTWNKKSFHPGQHIYLSRPFPNGTSPLSLSHMNPFSIANNPSPSADDTDPRIELVARTLHGSTKLLAEAAEESEGAPMPFLLEGPYGGSAHFPNLLSYDTVLLVAGGVGATFTLPIYQDLLLRLHAQNPPANPSQEIAKPDDISLTDTIEGLRARHIHNAPSATATASSTPRIRFLHSVRSVADAQWALNSLHRQHQALHHYQHERDFPEGFELYVTGDDGADVKRSLGASGLAFVRHGRPDLRAVVDEVFGGSGRKDGDGEGNGVERAAVLVCGPHGLGRDLRREVGKWVWRGKEVFWHEESFSW